MLQNHYASDLLLHSSDVCMHCSSSSLVPCETTAHLFLFVLSTEPGQQKSFKRKRSLINWPFWKGSNTQLDGLPLSPTTLSPTQGRLFGRPLSSVCSPEHGLPKPVMVSRVQVTQVSRRGQDPVWRGHRIMWGLSVSGRGRCSCMRKQLLSDIALSLHLNYKLNKWWTCWSYWRSETSICWVSKILHSMFPLWGIFKKRPGSTWASVCF